MHLDRYTIKADHQHYTYEFLSRGPKGTIKKVVLFQPLRTGIINLAFGDWDEDAQSIRDDIRSNNADRDKVLATVAFTVMDFMEHYPETILFAQGATPARTRLYQIGINNHWQEISKLFRVEGFTNGTWEPFRQNRNYQAFVLRTKQ
jgi:hypothetical protein